MKESKRLGYDNVLFLDAIGRENIEEMSGMNVFAKFGDTWKTPPIGDTILDGVTRKSIIDLCREQNFKVTEENFTIKELTQGAKSGELKEFFACGTAAAITTIREIGWQGENYQINGGEIGADTQTLFSAMTGIHYGQRQAPNPEWLIEI